MFCTFLADGVKRELVCRSQSGQGVILTGNSVIYLRLKSIVHPIGKGVDLPDIGF